MAGKKATSNALHFKWQGTSRPADGKQEPYRSKVAVIAVGRTGNKTITKLVKMGITEAKMIAIDTDSKNLTTSQADQKILISKKLTRRHTASGNLASRKTVTHESQKQIEEAVAERDIVFVTAGLRGGTGTHVAPVIAEIAKKTGVITVGVVVAPFQARKKQMKQASQALNELRRQCDTVVVIDGSKLTELTHQLQMDETLEIADQVSANVIRSMIETISTPSLINPDLTDFKTIVKRGGVAVASIGESDASNRAEEAVRNALKTPLSNAGYTGARGAVVHVTGDAHMTVEEANHVGEIVTEMMNKNAQVVWGAKVDPNLKGRIRVTLVMTGVNSPPMTSDFTSITHNLFNLEPYSGPERKLPINLGLYQLESSES